MRARPERRRGRSPACSAPRTRASPAPRGSLRPLLHGLRSCLVLVGAATVSAITSCASFAASPSDPAVTADASAESHDGSSDAGGTDTTAKDASVEADADAARAPCRGEAACRRYVFVTSDLYAGEDIGGSIGADGRCTNRAVRVSRSTSVRSNCAVLSVNCN